MRLRSIVLVTIASLGIAIPIALAKNPTHSQTICPMQNTGTMSRMGMMHTMQVNSEFAYLTQMIPHHQEAIDTARLVLAKSDRPEMKRFAQEILQVQTSEIQQMQRWLRTWYPGQNTAVSYSPMMRDLNNLQGDAIDQAFLQDMIMHHMGAVMMSHRLINHNLVQHEPVRPFAQQIASSQQQEMRQMQSWLQTWFGAPGTRPGMRHGPGMIH